MRTIDVTVIFTIIIILVIPLLFLALVALTNNLSFWSFLTKYVIYILFFMGSGFLVFLGMLLSSLNPKVGRIISYLGLTGIMVFLIILEMYFFAPFLENYSKVNEKFFSCIDDSDILCIFLGTKTYRANIWENIGFYLFIVAIPLVILISIFIDFIGASEVIRSPKLRTIIGICMGFLAYRGFLVTKLIYILDIGSIGVATIAVNFIWLGGILGYVKRSFAQWRILEEEQKMANDIRDASTRLLAIANTWKTANQIKTSFSNIDFILDLYTVFANDRVKVNELVAEARKIISGEAETFIQRFKREIESMIS